MGGTTAFVKSAGRGTCNDAFVFYRHQQFPQPFCELLALLRAQERLQVVGNLLARLFVSHHDQDIIAQNLQTSTSAVARAGNTKQKEQRGKRLTESVALGRYVSSFACTLHYSAFDIMCSRTHCTEQRKLNVPKSSSWCPIPGLKTHLDTPLDEVLKSAGELGGQWHWSIRHDTCLRLLLQPVLDSTRARQRQGAGAGESTVTHDSLSIPSHLNTQFSYGASK